MGGEYLPDLEKYEVEIARISLKTLLSDQLTIRAWQDGRVIRYRVEDEYQTKYEPPFEYSFKPLTLRKLIRFINGVEDGYHEGGVVIGFWEQESYWGKDEAKEFLSIDSAYYPDLQRYYTEFFDRWSRKRFPDVYDPRSPARIWGQGHIKYD